MPASSPPASPTPPAACPGTPPPVNPGPCPGAPARPVRGPPENVVAIGFSLDGNDEP